MKKIICMISLAAMMNACVIKKDATAAAATSVNLAKKIAQGFAGGPIAPGSAQITGPVNNTQPTCSSTISFTAGTTTTCSTDTFEFYMVSNSSAITGYEKFKSYEIKDGSSKYLLSGKIDISGTILTTYPADFSVITVNAAMTFNGSLAIAGSDSFTVTFKNYKTQAISTYDSKTFGYTYSYTCSGILTVESIDYKIKTDCSIDA